MIYHRLEEVTAHGSHSEQSDEDQSIIVAYALVRPHAVVIHSWDASVADTAVMSALRL